MNGTLQRRDLYSLRPARTQKSASSKRTSRKPSPAAGPGLSPPAPGTLRNQCGLLTWSAVLGYSTWNRLRDVPHRMEGGHAEAGGRWEKHGHRGPFLLHRQAGTPQWETGRIYDSNVAGQQIEAWSLMCNRRPSPTAGLHIGDGDLFLLL